MFLESLIKNDVELKSPLPLQLNKHCHKANLEIFYQKFTKLLIQWIGRKLHRTGDDDLRGDGVEHLLVLVYDQARHVRHDLTLEELLAHVDLGGDKENVSGDCRPHTPGCLAATFG